MARLLITGGAGFIGSHTCVVLLNAGHDLVIVDSFANSSPIATARVANISGLTPNQEKERLVIIEGDIRDEGALSSIFENATKQNQPIEGVIHLAGLKSVMESITQPLKYWDVNVNGSRCLLSIMEAHNCRTIVFSSSATIYGNPESFPIAEVDPIQPINPYGATKAAVESMLSNLQGNKAIWHIACLRYFNPVGAHPSGLIGEDPKNIPNNLFPLVCQVAIDRRKLLNVFGGDWPTPDGTCIRDYIHIMDLAEGHLAAINSLLRKESNYLTLNIGTGKGYSVLEIINEFEKTSGEKIAYKIVNRRDGDTAISLADPSQANKKISWRATRNIEDICRDSWNWQRLNPTGFTMDKVI